jgi:hypothetical protein
VLRFKEKEDQMHIRPKPMRALLFLGFLLAGVVGMVPVATALEVGERAPDFTLPSTMGGEVSLSQFRGKNHILLEFYLSDFGPN